MKKLAKISLVIAFGIMLAFALTGCPNPDDLTTPPNGGNTTTPGGDNPTPPGGDNPPQTFSEGGLIYELSGDESFYSVRGYDNTITTANIRASIEGIPVTTILDGAFLCYGSLTDITIPSSVTSIGIMAFTECTSLTSITFEGIITAANLGDCDFWSPMVDLRNKYLAGGPGTYIRDGMTWTKQ